MSHFPNIDITLIVNVNKVFLTAFETDNTYNFIVPVFPEGYFPQVGFNERNLVL
jgi:hypothetical protein